MAGNGRRKKKRRLFHLLSLQGINLLPAEDVDLAADEVNWEGQPSFL